MRFQFDSPWCGRAWWWCWHGHTTYEGKKVPVVVMQNTTLTFQTGSIKTYFQIQKGKIFEIWVIGIFGQRISRAFQWCIYYSRVFVGLEVMLCGAPAFNWCLHFGFVGTMFTRWRQMEPHWYLQNMANVCNVKTLPNWWGTKYHQSRTTALKNLYSTNI